MTEYRYDINKIKHQARDRWFDILPVLSPALSDAVSNAGNHVACPVHENSVDGFRLFADGGNDGMGICNTCHAGKKPVDGIGLLMWVNDWTMYQALKAVGDLLNDGAVSIQPASRARCASRAQPAKPKPHAGVKYLLDTSSRKPNNAALLYYGNRGLVGAENFVCQSIQYHDGAHVYVSGQKLHDATGAAVKYPCIIGRASSSKGWHDGIHQIFITKSGMNAHSEIIEIAKKSGLSDEMVNRIARKPQLGSLSGGAVRFGSAGAVLGVGEGVETMLAVREMTGSDSLAACGTTALLTSVDIPPQVEKLIIYADHDRNCAGLNAAEALKARVLSEKSNVTKVAILLPDMPVPADKKGVDWLDYLNTGRKTPSSFQNQTHMI